MSKHYEQRKEANARWAAKKERFYMYLDPEDKEDFAAYAKAKGESLTAFLIRCAKTEMERNPIETPQEHFAEEQPPMNSKLITYGELFSMFVQQHPEIVVDDYRPAPGAYALTVWEKETHNVYTVRYRPDCGQFTVETAQEHS